MSIIIELNHNKLLIKYYYFQKYLLGCKYKNINQNHTHDN